MPGAPCSYPGCVDMRDDDPRPDALVQTMVRRSGYEGLCFYCAFWLSQSYDRVGAVVARGQHYRIGPEGQRGDRGMRGFGGARFAFRMLADGAEIVSTNTWSQGTVPERFRTLIPDNAVALDADGKPKS